MGRRFTEDRQPLTGLVVVLASPRAKSDDEYVREMEKALEAPTLEERLSAWKKPRDGESLEIFGPKGKYQGIFEHKMTGFKPDTFIAQSAMYGRSSGKTMMMANIVREARQRGIKVTSVIHDELQLEGTTEAVEEMKRKLLG